MESTMPFRLLGFLFLVFGIALPASAVIPLR